MKHTFDDLLAFERDHYYERIFHYFLSDEQRQVIYASAKKTEALRNACYAAHDQIHLPILLMAWSLAKNPCASCGGNSFQAEINKIIAEIDKCIAEGKRK